MKRVTIIADDIGEPDEDGERLLMGVRSPGFGEWVAADRVVSVEDHVEPLPAAPGICFLGKTRDTGPQRWFVRMLDDSSMYYLPARGGRAVRAEDAQHVGLVRLPDPKPTEAADR